MESLSKRDGIFGKETVYLEKRRYIWKRDVMCGKSFQKRRYIWKRDGIFGKETVYLEKRRYIWKRDVMCGKSFQTYHLFSTVAFVAGSTDPHAAVYVFHHFLLGRCVCVCVCMRERDTVSLQDMRKESAGPQ